MHVFTGEDALFVSKGKLFAFGNNDMELLGIKGSAKTLTEVTINLEHGARVVDVYGSYTSSYIVVERLETLDLIKPLRSGSLSDVLITVHELKCSL